MVSLVIFSTEIQMDFGCATLSVKIGIVADCEGIDLPIGIIRALPIGSCCKYLGVVEAGEFQCKDVKYRIKERDIQNSIYS